MFVKILVFWPVCFSYILSSYTRICIFFTIGSIDWRIRRVYVPPKRQQSEANRLEYIFFYSSLCFIVIVLFDTAIEQHTRWHFNHWRVEENKNRKQQYKTPFSKWCLVGANIIFVHSIKKNPFIEGGGFSNSSQIVSNNSSCMRACATPATPEVSGSLFPL